MARNLSERLLDMVEDDPRLIGLEPAAVIVWLKLIRLFVRAPSRRRPDGPPFTYSFRETAQFLRVTEDELRGHVAVLVSRGLLIDAEGRISAPIECNPLAAPRRPKAENRFVPQIVPIGRR
jgi:hypothetical protein